MAEVQIGEVHVSALSAALIRYTRGLFVPETPEITAIDEAARAAGMPVGWEVTPDVGRLFQLFTRAIGARRALEFGTFAGHSAFWFASALPEGGRVVSIERDPSYAAIAQQALVNAGVGDRVEIRVGECRNVLPALTEEIERTGERYDVIFLDADKAHYPEFLDWTDLALRPGGVLFADNVLTSESWGSQTLLDPAADDPRILAIREFNRRLATHPKFMSLIVPIRAGIAVGLKLE